MSGTVMALAVCGAATGILLLLFPSGSAGAAGRRAVSVCCLLECARLIYGALRGG